METLERLGAADLVSVLAAYRDVLRTHQPLINRLNVYPVPDGDTGTNMALTLESVMAELDPLEHPDLAAVCRAISHGSLMGARGNSGVILSQVLRGMADAFLEGDAGDASTVADALERGAAGAYGAVMRPVEGTILTVVREAAAAARRATGAGGTSVVEVLDAARLAARAALDATPEQLPVLKQAGVVDAGGAGFVLLFDAFLHVTAGRPVPVPEPDRDNGRSTGTAAGPEGPSAPVHDPVGDLRYEVMYLLEAPAETIPAFKDVWAGVGDSIVVVGGDNLWNCHIHTDDIGAAVEAALDVGRPRRIRVTDLFDQVEEERWVREADPDGSGGEESVAVRCAVVAVATGEGIRRIFHSLGVHQIVAGGQTMNPSTAQLLEAIEAASAPEVVILPNNANIVPVARQAAELSAKAVRVVATPGIAEGFAALLEYDPEASADDNSSTMAGAAARVVAGEITRAVRPSASPAGAIREGDWLGLSRDAIEVVGAGLAQVACELLGKLVDDSHEIVTVIEGDGATPAATRRITGWLEQNRPAVTAEIHHGGQPLYPYLFSIE